MEDQGEAKYRTVVTKDGHSISAVYHGDEIDKMSDEEFVAMFRKFVAQAEREKAEGPAPE